MGRRTTLRARPLRAPKQPDTTAARELEQFIENDGDLYRQQYEPIIKNLMTKRAKGLYDSEKAVKLFGYLVESGAKKYHKEFGGGGAWNTHFDPATRLATARSLEKSFRGEAEVGAYDDFLPKKYRK
jgi:hypothetical protein